MNRWKRYGKDRLYVSLPDGTKVGFWDLASDEGHPATREQLPVLLRAVEGWRGNQGADLAAMPIPLLAAPLPAAGGLKNPPAGSMVAQSRATADTPTALDEAVLGEALVARPWMDLATNQPGVEAREQAQAARDAAPVKTVLARVLGVHTEERAWRIGADGEERVAAQLAKVAKKDPRWRFLHAIPVGDRGSDIDHLLIGPGGVFTVNAKNHPRRKDLGRRKHLHGERTPSALCAQQPARSRASREAPHQGLRLPGLRPRADRDCQRRRRSDQEPTRWRQRHLAQQPRQVATATWRNPPVRKCSTRSTRPRGARPPGSPSRI